MKKLLVMLTAVAMIFGFAAGAYAANQVQVTLTSPVIVKQGCEKAGSVTFAFDGNSVITAGDWWYMDLPSTVTICKPFDYIVGNVVVAPVAAGLANINNGSQAAVIDATLAIPSIPLGTTVGPMSVTDAGGGGALVAAGGRMVFRVVGSGRRVTITAYGTAAGATLTVPANTKFSIKILDGATHSTASNYPASIILDAGDEAGDGVYGNYTANPENTVLAGPVPDVTNTLCIDAEAYAGDLVFVSFASLLDKFTFTGDSQIAHVGAAAQLVLAACKGEITEDILIASGQGAGCTFEYETATSYCANMTSWGGNKMILQNSTTFGDVGDLYSITVTSDTAGVYFGGTATIVGYTPTDTLICAGAGVGDGTVVVPTAWEAWTATTSTGTTFPASCTFTTTNRIVKVNTVAGAIGGIHTYDRLVVDLPTMYYDSSIIGNGTEVDVTITMGKYPCGDFFTGTRTIGTFVTTCAAGGATTNLMYPFLPALDGSIPGWWGGFTINNAGAVAGTAVLSFYESDGDTATYTTDAIAANSFWTMPAAQLLTVVTPGATNAGTFGDANVMIVVNCNFGGGGGFAFTGNGEEGTGYTAYVQAGGVWH